MASPPRTGSESRVVCNGVPMSTRVHIILSDATLERLDELRGREPRSSFVRHLIEQRVSKPDPETVAWAKQALDDLDEAGQLPPAPKRTPERPSPTRCPECGSIGRIHQRGCSKG
jgi:rRNA maturation endonuclease Nob1